jgi:flagellin-like protein
MKANRKFLNNDDEAVSPVIAVILMVAITVVLAATVYVWVSGFGSNSSQPAKTLALTSNGGIADCNGATAGTAECKVYVVASASPGLRWQDLTFTLNGVTQTYAAEGCTTATTPAAANTYAACDGAGATEAVTTVMQAGHEIRIQAPASSLSGETFRVLDSASNSIILTLTAS